MLKNRLTSKQKYSLILLFSVLSIALLYLFQDKLASLGSWGLLGLFLINVAGGLFLFPSPVILASVLAAGHSYPPLYVAIIAALGSSLGDVLGYVLGYAGRRAFVEKRSKKYEILEELFHKFGGFLILLLAMIPNPFFDGIGIVAGLFLYPAKKFFLYVFIGRLLRNLLLAYIGSSI